MPIFNNNDNLTSLSLRDATDIAPRYRDERINAEEGRVLTGNSKFDNIIKNIDGDKLVPLPHELEGLINMESPMPQSQLHNQHPQQHQHQLHNQLHNQHPHNQHLHNQHLQQHQSQQSHQSHQSQQSQQSQQSTLGSALASIVPNGNNALNNYSGLGSMGLNRVNGSMGLNRVNGSMGSSGSKAFAGLTPSLPLNNIGNSLASFGQSGGSSKYKLTKKNFFLTK